VPAKPVEPAKAPPKARPETAGGESDEAAGSYESHMALASKLGAAEPDKAKTHLQFAARMRPGSPEPWTRMGDLEFRRGNLDAASTHYGTALSKTDYGPALIGMARVSAREGNAASARGYYRRYLDVNSMGSQAEEARKYLGEP